MKIDYDLTKAILSYIEETANGHDTVWCYTKNIPVECTQDEIDYHIMILHDDGLLVATNMTMRGHIALERLTAEGHRVLEAMNTSQIQEQLKDFLDEVGKAGIKKIPALAIKLILGT
ncbi:MAG: DUF2513 domain-containing protein [Alphaproteobacteria bacterium]